MLCDEEQGIRREAVKRVLDLRRNKLNLEDGLLSGDEAYGKTRSNDEKSLAIGIRPYKLPNVNFLAESYTELFDWERTIVHIPPLIQKMTNNEIEDIIDIPLHLPPYMCHNQPVERAVKVVTEASRNVCGEDNRDGFIRQRLKSRKLMPRTNSKQDFNLNFY